MDALMVVGVFGESGFSAVEKEFETFLRGGPLTGFTDNKVGKTTDPGQQSSD